MAEVIVQRLADLSPQQWRSGIAAWLGWMFDGLELHLYTVVATPIVAELLHTDVKDEAVGYYSSLIQAAFLVGWAVGGGLFGWLGDRVGRSRTLALTILTYAIFTGGSFFAVAVVATARFSLPCRAGNRRRVGRRRGTAERNLAAPLAAVDRRRAADGRQRRRDRRHGAGDSHREPALSRVFLVGVLPAPGRRLDSPCRAGTAGVAGGAWPARAATRRVGPLPRQNPADDAFDRGGLRVCALGSLGLSLLVPPAPAEPSGRILLDRRGEDPPGELGDNRGDWQLDRGQFRRRLVCPAVRLSPHDRRGVRSVLRLYRRGLPRPLGHEGLEWLFVPIGMCQGLFALFTMYLPPLFPTLLRTTGAGFCYNVGRIAAAFAVVFFGHFSTVGDPRLAILYASLLFLPAAALVMRLEEPSDV